MSDWWAAALVLILVGVPLFAVWALCVFLSRLVTHNRRAQRGKDPE